MDVGSIRVAVATARGSEVGHVRLGSRASLVPAPRSTRRGRAAGWSARRLAAGAPRWSARAEQRRGFGVHDARSAGSATAIGLGHDQPRLRPDGRLPVGIVADRGRAVAEQSEQGLRDGRLRAP